MAAPEFLSDEWHAAATRLGSQLPEVDGADATIVFVVGGGPDGERRYRQVIERGRLVAQDAIGAKDKANAEADITFTIGWNDALALHRGELDVNVAFMEGRMKVAGNVPKLFPLLKLTSSPHYQQMRTELLSN